MLAIIKTTTNLHLRVKVSIKNYTMHNIICEIKKNLKHGLLFSQMEKKQKLLFRILEKIVSKQTIILLIFFSNQVRIIIFLIWDRQFKIR